MNKGRKFFACCIPLLFLVFSALSVLQASSASSAVVEYTATEPAFNVATNNFAMRFNAGVILPGTPVELQFTVTANTSNDNRDQIYCGDTVITGLGNAYPIHSDNLPATVTYNVGTMVAGRNLAAEDVIFSTDAWNPGIRENFFYGSLTFSNIVLRVTLPPRVIYVQAGAGGGITEPHGPMHTRTFRRLWRSPAAVTRSGRRRGATRRRQEPTVQNLSFSKTGSLFTAASTERRPSGSRGTQR